MADWPSKFITVLSPDGEVLRTIGSAGEGPGEFEYISNVQILRGDSLLVLDQQLGRLTVFAPHSDDVAYTINLFAATGLSAPYWAKKASRGSYVAAYKRSFSTSDNPAEDDKRHQVLRLLNADGSLQRDSILVFPSRQTLVVRHAGGLALDGTPPFARRPVYELGSDDRIYYGWTDSLAIETYSLEGQHVGSISEPSKPVPITDQDIEAAVNAETDSWREDFRIAFEEYIPATWPTFESFVVDDEDRIWVGVETPAGEPTQWVAFDDSGTRFCSAALPEDVQVELIRDGKAYGVATNDLDVPRVVVYRIDHQ